MDRRTDVPSWRPVWRRVGRVIGQMFAPDPGGPTARCCQHADGATMTATDTSLGGQGHPTGSVTTAPRGSAYSALSRQIKQAGLLDRRLGYYAALIALLLALVAAGATALVVIGDSWWQLLVAGYFAV